MTMKSATSNCAVNNLRLQLLRTAVAFLIATVSAPASACTLEAVVNGGFTLSHPGALEVAAAVAKARRESLLSPAPSETLPNDMLLRLMITSLRRVQLHLDGAIPAGETEPDMSFSLVLVGPGLWSHFHQSSGGLLARYHVEGPLRDGVVVLTHHAVLEALLQRTMSAETAAAHGLIEFAGKDADHVRRMFVNSFDAKA